ncbi:hypothetical protein THII_2111 [Thioploca ingrica]|uniref:Uncharacterized protein n=1 Tax=Thioploca ingrica TaxID=40754 RepID=A0A090AEJ4_9GAMM|nr:hypothetical protein THII_2111 [Thioploca ingrica]
MQRKYLFNALIWLNAINMTLPLSTKANKEEPLPLSSPPSMELTEPVLTVPNIAVKIVGTAKEQAELEPVQAIVKNILNNSKLGVVKLPVSDGCSVTPAMKVAQHLEIVIGEKAFLESPRSYQVSISLQEKGLQSTAKLFDYFLNDPDKLYQNLKNYLTEYLNLQPKATTAQVVTVQSAQSQSVAPLLTPSPPDQLAANPPSVPSSPANPKSGTVFPQQEIQLKNMSPTVKHIAIKLQGTEREKEELEEVQTMINQILNSSKLDVVRIPVPNEPVTTPAIKVYENLEIVIGIKSPDQVNQAYQVNITLQEQGSPVEARLFEYYPHDNQKFFNELKAYLTEHLNLQPRISVN